MTRTDPMPLPFRARRGRGGSGAVPRRPDGEPAGDRGEILATMPSRLCVGAGAWLVVAPFVLGYSTTAAAFHAYWSDVATGIVLVFLGLLRIALPVRTTWLLPVVGALGCWLVAAPFALGFALTGDAPRATANDIVLGVVVTALACLSTVTERRLSR